MEKLEAMTSVCAAGLDMIAVPGSVDAETIAAIIAKQLAVVCKGSKVVMGADFADTAGGGSLR